MSRSTALLIVDMQNDFLLPGAPLFCAGAREIIPAVKELIAGARQRKWPVIYVIRSHDIHGIDAENFRMHLFEKGAGYAVDGTSGMEVVAEIAPLPEDYIIEKVRFSAFFATKLDLVLRRLDIKRLVIGGLQYPNCIRATAVDGISYDYDVQICTDATWGATPAVVAANIYDLEKMNVKCLPMENIFAANQ